MVSGKNAPGNPPISQEVVDPATGEIGGDILPPALSDAELASIDSIGAIQSFLGEEGFTEASDLGSGFALLDRAGKDRLCGIPLVFLFWRFLPGDNGDFVSAHVAHLDLVTGKVLGKFILNDGGVGIYQQLLDVTERRMKSGMSESDACRKLIAKRGLRRSEYDNAGPNADISGVTHYIDTSAVA